LGTLTTIGGFSRVERVETQEETAGPVGILDL